MDNQSPDLVISRLRQKDPAVIEELFDTYSPALYGIIHRIVKDPGLADQILQDSFLKIYNNGDQYNAGEKQLFTWLSGIARQTAMEVKQPEAADLTGR